MVIVILDNECTMHHQEERRENNDENDGWWMEAYLAGGQIWRGAGVGAILEREIASN